MTRSRHEAEIRRRVPLSCKAAFACFTEAHHLERWFGRGSMSAKVALHVGGKFLFDFAPGEGPADRIEGEYLEVVSGKRLVFTFELSHPGSSEERDPVTVVAIDFVESGDGCEVVLKHSELMNETDVDEKSAGWRNIIHRLSTYADSSGLCRTN